MASGCTFCCNVGLHYDTMRGMVTCPVCDGMGLRAVGYSMLPDILADLPPFEEKDPFKPWKREGHIYQRFDITVADIDWSPMEAEASLGWEKHLTEVQQKYYEQFLQEGKSQLTELNEPESK